MASSSEKTSVGTGQAKQKPRALFIIVMGVSGTGKSTLGTAISKAFGFPYVEGDELHPPSNIAKMSAGHPLNDADREPWLKLIRETAVKMTSKELKRDLDLKEKTDVKVHEEGQKKDVEVDLHDEGKDHDLHSQSPVGVVIGCSALKKYYRDILRGTYKLPSVEEKDLKVEVEAGTGSQGQTAEEEANSLSPYFVFLEGSREVMLDRMTKRQGHYMKASMLDSQLQTLEDPTGEPDVIPVSVLETTEEQLQKVVDRLDKSTGLDSAK